MPPSGFAGRRYWAGKPPSGTREHAESSSSSSDSSSSTSPNRNGNPNRKESGLPLVGDANGSEKLASPVGSQRTGKGSGAGTGLQISKIGPKPVPDIDVANVEPQGSNDGASDHIESTSESSSNSHSSDSKWSSSSYSESDSDQDQEQLEKQSEYHDKLWGHKVEFISREKRFLLAVERAQQEELQRLAEEHAKKLQDIRDQNSDSLMGVMVNARSPSAVKDVEELDQRPDDLDREDEFEAEYEKWKQREMMRIIRDYFPDLGSSEPKDASATEPRTTRDVFFAEKDKAQIPQRHQLGSNTKFRDPSASREAAPASAETISRIQALSRAGTLGKRGLRKHDRDPPARHLPLAEELQKQVGRSSKRRHTERERKDP